MEEIHFLAPGSFNGTFESFLQGVVEDDRKHVLEDINRAVRTGEDYHTQYRIRTPGGEVRWLEGRGQVVGAADGKAAGLAGVCMDVTERQAVEQRVRDRERQQALVARLGAIAIECSDLDKLMGDAVRILAQGLGVEYAKVLQLQPDGKGLLLRSGVGWKGGLEGKAIVGADRTSQAGYTLLSRGPVIVDDLRSGQRFSGPSLLRQHNVVSGLSVVIQGHERPFGVLGAHTSTRRAFTEDDVHFLESVANILAASIERKRSEDAFRSEQQRLQTIIDASPVGVIVFDSDCKVVLANREANSIFGFPSWNAGERDILRETQYVKPDGSLYAHEELP